jgi:hypothetical protein
MDTMELAYKHGQKPWEFPGLHTNTFLIFQITPSDTMSGEQPLYFNPDETSRIDQAFEACHPQLIEALEEIHQGPYEVTTEEQLLKFRERERANRSNAESVLNE